MSYVIPQPYTCPKCNSEHMYSPHNSFPAPVLRGEDGIDKPICPNCYAKFLQDTFPTLVRKPQQ